LVTEALNYPAFPQKVLKLIRNVDECKSLQEGARAIPVTQITGGPSQVSGGGCRIGNGCSHVKVGVRPQAIAAGGKGITD